MTITIGRPHSSLGALDTGQFAQAKNGDKLIPPLGGTKQPKDSIYDLTGIVGQAKRLSPIDHRAAAHANNLDASAGTSRRSGCPRKGFDALRYGQREAYDDYLRGFSLVLRSSKEVNGRSMPVFR